MSENRRKFSKNVKLLSRILPANNNGNRKSAEMPIALAEKPYNGNHEISEKETNEWTTSVLRKSMKAQLLLPLRLLKDVETFFAEANANELDAYFSTTPISTLNKLLLWAAFVGRLDCMRKLHDFGANLRYSEGTENLNALHISAFIGSLESCQWLLAIEPGLWNETHYGLTPLHYAVLGNWRQVTKFLIKESSRDICHTLLNSAIYSNSVECVKLLLSLGVDVNTYHDGMTALHSAVELDHTECIEYLLEQDSVQIDLGTMKAGNTALHIAANNGYFRSVEFLVQKGAEIAKPNRCQETPLHLACKMQHEDCVEILLANHAPVNVKDSDGRTPLHNAIKEKINSVSIVEMLIEWNADINVSDRFSYTPLHIAAIHEIQDCVDILILKGADVTTKTKGGVSALNVIKRRLPDCANSIRQRLTNALSYTYEQNLKFSFRDLLVNSNTAETNYLNILQQEGEEELLKHPLCKAFLYLKWKKVKLFYSIRALLTLTAVLLITLYVYSATIEQDCCYMQLRENKNHTPITVNQNLNISLPKLVLCPITNYSISVRACERFSEFKSFILNATTLDCYIGVARMMLLCILTFYVIRLCFSLPLYHSVRQFMNLLETLELTIIAMLILYYNAIMGNKEEEKDFICWFYYQKILGSIIVFLSWVLLLVINGQFFRCYVNMFKSVSYKSSNLLLVYLCLLLGFTCAFCILFQNTNEDFSNPIHGLIKVFAMMTGEITFTETLENIEPPFLKQTVLLFLALFIILITFVLMSLMVGIAVNDVEGLYKTAELTELVYQTQIIYGLEMVCFNGFFPTVVKNYLRKILYLWPEAYQKVIYVRPNDNSGRILPKEIIDEALILALSKHTKSKDGGEHLQMSKKMELIQRQIDEVQNTLIKANGKIMRVAENVEEIEGKFERKLEELHKVLNQLDTFMREFEKRTAN